MNARGIAFAALFVCSFVTYCLGDDALDHWYRVDSRALTRIRFLGNQFVGVGTNGTILTSPNGKVWTARNSGTTADLRGVTWTSGRYGPPFTSRFVVVGAGATILISPDA